MSSIYLIINIYKAIVVLSTWIICPKVNGKSLHFMYNTTKSFKSFYVIEFYNKSYWISSIVIIYHDRLSVVMLFSFLRSFSWKIFCFNVKILLEFCKRIGKLPMWNLEEILDQNQSELKRNGQFQWNQQSQWNGLIQSRYGRKVYHHT